METLNNQKPQKSAFWLLIFGGGMVLAVCLIFAFVFFVNNNLSGLFSSKTLPLPTMTPNVTTIPGSAVVDLDTANWKTFSNDEIGIEFKYPPSWDDFSLFKESYPDSTAQGEKISISGNGFLLNAYTVDYVVNYMEDGEVLKYLGRSIDKSRLNCSDYEIQDDCRNFEIDGRKAISAYEVGSYVGAFFLRKIVLIENPGQKFTGIAARWMLKDTLIESPVDEQYRKAYLIDIQKRIKNNELSDIDKKGVDLFDKIVSTIRFTPTIPVNWQVYQNEEYGYQIGYPADYHLSANTDPCKSPLCAHFIPKVLPNGYYDYIQVEVKDRNNTSMQDWISGKAESDTCGYNVAKETIVSGAETIIVTPICTMGIGTEYTAFILGKDFVYKIYRRFRTLDDFEKLLATFKFFQ